jgi:type IV fimbrial biogenesis protein FimT
MDVGTCLSRRCRGLTLIELMTTLAVAGISLAILVPGWYGLSNRNQISSTSNQLLGHLRYARSEAVSRYSDISLCPSEDGIACSGDPRGWHKGYIIFVDQDSDRSRAEDEELLWHQQSQARNLRLHSTAGRPAVRFRPDGGAWGTNTTFSICIGDDPDLNRVVVLYGSGRARTDRRAPGNRTVSCT